MSAALGMRANLLRLSREKSENADGRAFGIVRFSAEDHSAPIERIEPIEPWASLRYPSGWLSKYMTQRDAGLYRFALLIDEMAAGFMAVRFPWLVGPFLELLAIEPDHQRAGLGAFAVSRLQDAARRAERQLWTSVSTHNRDAARFYERLGFSATADVPDLLRAGFTERLLRFDART